MSGRNEPDEQAPGGDPPNPPGSIALRLSGLGLRYGPIRSLDRVDLTVRTGERVAIVGPSGAGKSSLLNVVAGLVVPTSGSVDVLGARLDQLSGRALRQHRRRVGVIGQQLHLALPLRVVHNVNAGALGWWSTARALWSLARPADRDEVSVVLGAVGLADRIDARTDELSGGERQRVAVARVLRHRPQLVLADEPTSSIDPALSDNVMELLCRGLDDERGPTATSIATTAGEPAGGRGDGERAAGRTVVVSVHDPDLARRHTDRVVGLRDGRIVFDSPAGAVEDRTLDRLYHGS